MIQLWELMYDCAASHKGKSTYPWVNNSRDSFIWWKLTILPWIPEFPVHKQLKCHGWTHKQKYQAVIWQGQK